jgi:YfiR/HmsC-like
MRLSRFMIAVSLCLSLAMGANAQSSDSPESSEYLIKAGFIYNFAQLVQWPASAFSQEDSPIVIGILGTDPFGAIIDRVIENKKLAGRTLVVKRLKRGAAVKDCNILFVSSSEAAHLDEVIQSTKGMPILTIGETPGFAVRGGIINLTLEGNRVRFEVNIEAAKQANLNISSRLLALARIVPQAAADARKSE